MTNALTAADLLGGYTSWNDFLTRCDRADIMAWCHNKAKQANRKRLMSVTIGRITKYDVWFILTSAQGHCRYCGSLAVEKLPPGRWDDIGHRVGSLEHIIPIYLGGTNTIVNLAWSCYRCNASRYLRRLLTAAPAPAAPIADRHPA